MPEEISQLMIPIVIFLLLILLAYKIEKRKVKESIYKNFPFFKDTLDNFQHKIDYLSVRLEVLEDKINKLENKT